MLRGIVACCVAIPLALLLVIGFAGAGRDGAAAKNDGHSRTDKRGADQRLTQREDTEPATANAKATFISAPPVFPLTVPVGKRYLVDAAGTPFLIHGDAAWSLISQLTREDVDRYLSDRLDRGFNTILVSLIEHQFSGNRPGNAYGERPFLSSGDYSAPNDHYFAHVDWVLEDAAQKGFLLLLVPSYMGFGGGPEGWYQEMVANGPAKLREYGRFLGQRYQKFRNILWVHGADYNPPDRDLVRSIVDGIRDFDRRALHSAQCAPETSAAEFWDDEPWLNVNSIYTYQPVFLAAVREYSRSKVTPFFLIESAYENEHNATAQRLRTQAYHAVLSGAAGQVFGNNPVWHFDGPGLYPAPTTWLRALASSGAQSMTHLRSLFSAVSWWQLEPDVNNTFLVSGLGEGQNRAVAARAADRSFAIVYIPSIRDLTVDLSELAGQRFAVRWFDPASGEFVLTEGSPSAETGLWAFRPPARKNSSGSYDWLLLVESRW